MRKVHMKYDKGFVRRFKTCIHYVSSSFISGNRHFVKESPKKVMTVLAVPFGIVLYLLVRYNNRERI